ncbi:MAG: thioredoxin family protein [Nitrospirota bacterium]
MTHAVAGKPPDVLFLMASGCPCPHCSNVLQGLTQLVHEGTIGRLEVVNVTAFPDRAEVLGVDTIPWVRIGPFELEGMLSLAELREWLGRKDNEEGMAAYFEYLLASGRREKVVRIVRRQPERMSALIRLLGGGKTTLHVRLGIGAVLEELQGTEAVRSVVQELGRLTTHGDARVRGDACYLLTFTHTTEAVPYLTACRQDLDKDVREIAKEALEVLRADGVHPALMKSAIRQAGPP